MNKHIHLINTLLHSTPSASTDNVGAIAGGVVAGLLLAVLTVIILVMLVVWWMRRDPAKSKSPDQVIEMDEGLQVRIIKITKH